MASRPKLLNLLHKLHQTQKPRVVLGLRTQDEIPEWITHIALVQDGTVRAGPKNNIIPLIKHDTTHFGSLDMGTIEAGPIVLDLQNVNVKYGDRVVSSIHPV